MLSSLNGDTGEARNQKPRLTLRPSSSTYKSPVYAGVTQLVECNLAKVDVEGSNPFARSTPYNQVLTENGEGESEKVSQGLGKFLRVVLPF